MHDNRPTPERVKPSSETSDPRRPSFRKILLVAGGIAILVAGLVIADMSQRPPSQSEAAETVFGNLLHYDELHGEPHVVFHNNNRIYFDQLTRDYKYMLKSGFRSGWVMTGKWYFLDEMTGNDAPVSIGVARCTGIMGESCDKDTELFGEITTEEVTTLTVSYDGEWHEFPVEAPGYAVRLDGFDGVPDGYQWLNVEGEVVHEEGPAPALQPGRSQPR